MKTSLLKSLSHMGAFSNLTEKDLSDIDSRGLAHDHVKLGKTGWIARIPRGNQLGMEPADYLNLQKDIYAAMGKSGVTPDILDAIAPNDDFPNGILIVEYIDGRDIQSEADLKAVAKCLGEIHKMPVPDQAGMIEKAAHPLAGQEFLLTEVFDTALASDKIAPETRDFLQAERKELFNQIETLKEQDDIPMSIIGGDSHLGNYLIDKKGKAWLVDLEFAAYDLGLVDLADASLAITSHLDPHIGVIPSEQTVDSFYETWKDTVGLKMAQKSEALIPLTERIVQLRTLAWLSHWVTEGRDQEKDKVSQKSLENWDKMAAHYLAPKNLRQIFNDKARKHRLPKMPPNNRQARKNDQHKL